MSKNRLIYLPLGGAGEIGMNCYVYGYGPAGQERLIVVDLGVTFPDMDTTPGLDLIMPDVKWLEERVDRIEAIFITHAHEDHIGAIGHLWPRLRRPVYTRRFTGAIARLKLEEHSQPQDVVHIVEPRPHTVNVGPFKVQFVPLAHSIPESSALIIDTPAGRIVHSGDFKLDPLPIVGEAWQPELFDRIGKEVPVLALMCDSTNVFSPHAGRSEASLAAPITELISKAKGMVVATTFASNVARLKTLAEAGQAAGRSVCLLGRAMQRMLKVSQETGVLTDFPPTVPVEQAAEMAGQNVMLIVTGSQGERRAATAQLARGKYLGVDLKKGDMFLFSSKIIPGNERGVLGIMNAFSEMGVDVVDDHDGLYHVSGHANRPDLQTMHNLLKPKFIIPMHGEHRHLREHVKLATSAGVIGEIVPNGTMIDLSGDRPAVVDRVDTARLYLDGSVLIGAMEGVIRDRIRLALNGHIIATVIMDEQDEPLGEAWIELMGLPDRCARGVGLAEVLENEINQFLEGASAKVLRDDTKLEEAIRRILKQSSVIEIGKKPEVTVIVSRLQEE